MPSWNIHIAHAEGLLLDGGPVARAVRDRNAFMFGSVVPDIFVGYMVPGVAEPIAYVVTHLAEHEPIPKPREREFWDAYVSPLLNDPADMACAVEGAGSPCDGEPSAFGASAERRDSANPAQACPTTKTQEIERLNRVHYPHRYQGASPLPAASRSEFSIAPADVRRSTLDLTLGAWVHLVADNIWNARVNEYLDATGEKPSEQFRIKKQSDFDWFGKTLAIDSVPRACERLYCAAEAFPQYTIDREYVLKTIGVMHEIVRSNPGDPHHPPYRLLTDEFFECVFAEVAASANELFAMRTA